MKLLITRPGSAAAALAARLAALGHETVIEPLLTIVPEPDAAAHLAEALAGAQAVLFTSANGVEVFAAATPRRDLRVFAVGDATARAARAAGFAEVESAGGDVTDLAALVRARLKPEDGALVHGRGKDAAGDLAGTLGAAGFTVRPVALYRAEAASELAPEAASAIRDRRLDAALFFSPRTASSFVRLAAAAGLQQACAGMTALALSPAVEAALRPLAWRRVVVAAEPTEAALLEALDRLASETESAAGKRGDERMSERGVEIEGTVIKPANATGAAHDGAASQSSAATPPRAGIGRTPRSRRLLAALVLLCVFLVAALASAPYWTPRFVGGNGSSSGAEVTALKAKIDALQAELAGAAETRQHLADAEKRLADLEARSKSAPAPAESPGAAQQAQLMSQLSDRLASLEQRIASLGSGAPAEIVKSMQTEIQAIDHRLDEQSQMLAKLQQSAAQTPDRTDAALLLAVEQLHQAVLTSRPYEAELASVATLARQRPEIAAALRPLEVHAKQGLPSVAVLGARLEQLAPTLLNPAAGTADGDWRSAVWAKLRGLVSVRRVGPRAAAAGDTTEATLAEAEAALKGGDLSGAVAAMKKLAGAAAEGAEPWLADAEARLQAEAAVASLDTMLAGRFLGDQATPGSKP